MSLFAAASVATGALHQALYGEQVTITPKAAKPSDVNARKVVDPDRAAVTRTAIWDETPLDVFPHAREEKDASARKISGAKVVLTIAKADLPFVPQQGDLATRVATGERLAVADVNEDGISDWILVLSAARS